MSAPQAQAIEALRALRRDLLRRRFSAIEPRLRVEIALLALLAGGFLFWRARITFASIAHDRGPADAALAAAACWLALAATGGALAGASHARQLAGRPPGPAWLALPLPAAPLLAHLEWEARLRAAWVAPAAPALLVALVGLVPALWVAGLAVAFALVLAAAAAIGTRAGFAASRSRDAAAARLDPVTRRLVVGQHAAPPRRARARGGAWRRAPRWLTLWRKDFLLARRPTGARRRVVVPLLLFAASIAVWSAPLEPAAVRVLAFGLALLAAYGWGEWLIALAGEDPFHVLRVLPLGVADVWLSRAAWGAIAILAVAAGHAIAGRSLSPTALQLFLGWIAGATALLSILAVNHSLTMYPDERAAQRVYTLTLAIGIAASVMIPLLGWLTLLAAVLHSARRLSRWSTLDPTT